MLKQNVYVAPITLTYKGGCYNSHNQKLDSRLLGVITLLIIYSLHLLKFLFPLLSPTHLQTI